MVVIFEVVIYILAVTISRCDRPKVSAEARDAETEPQQELPAYRKSEDPAPHYEEIEARTSTTTKVQDHTSQTAMTQQREPVSAI